MAMSSVIMASRMKSMGALTPAPYSTAGIALVEKDKNLTVLNKLLSVAMAFISFSKVNHVMMATKSVVTVVVAPALLSLAMYATTISSHPFVACVAMVEVILEKCVMIRTKTMVMDAVPDAKYSQVSPVTMLSPQHVSKFLYAMMGHLTL